MPPGLRTMMASSSTGHYPGKNFVTEGSGGVVNFLNVGRLTRSKVKIEKSEAEPGMP